MGTFGCNEFLNQLEAWMEGARPSDAQAHVRGCANCRGVVADLDAIGRTAGAWAAEEAEPPARVWMALRAQLEQEGLIRQKGRRWTQSLKRWFEGAFTAAPRPALAGAYLVALIAVAVALAGPANKRLNEDRWISGTQTSTGLLSAQLNTAAQDTISSLSIANPVVTASLHDNLAIVDNYIALCEKSVREEPENEIARDYLYDAYQQKANLLAQMTERGDDGR
ncbi:MAG TPA: hypothetical protein VJO53_04955 [Candidatus Acidoferrales bacterium]|nr:hypothetical protein [Candidatus Acidoferrales bacterium]